MYYIKRRGLITIIIYVIYDIKKEKYNNIKTYKDLSGIWVQWRHASFFGRPRSGGWRGKPVTLSVSGTIPLAGSLRVKAGNFNITGTALGP
jgi:hypothetical protein